MKIIHKTKMTINDSLIDIKPSQIAIRYIDCRNWAHRQWRRRRRRRLVCIIGKLKLKYNQHNWLCSFLWYIEINEKNCFVLCTHLKLLVLILYWFFPFFLFAHGTAILKYYDRAQKLKLANRIEATLSTPWSFSPPREWCLLHHGVFKHWCDAEKLV